MTYPQSMAIPDDDPRLDVNRAPGGQPRSEPASAADEAADEAADGAADEPFPTLDDAMRHHIEAALVRCKGRIEGEHGAARLLAIHANTLRSRMHKLGIHWERFRTRGRSAGL